MPLKLALSFAGIVLIAGICADPVNGGAREVALLPDRVRVRWHRAGLDASRVRSVLDQMAALATMVESPGNPR